MIYEVILNISIVLLKPSGVAVIMILIAIISDSGENAWRCENEM